MLNTTAGHRRRRAIPGALAIAMIAMVVFCASSRAQDWSYTVRKGDNPWDLTERYLAGIRYWPRIQALNNINDPLHILPGTVLRIPIDWLRREPAQVRISAVNGDAQVRRDGTVEAAYRGMEIGVGASIETGEEGNLTLSFGDGSRLLLHADSQLQFERLQHFENTGFYDSRLRLVRGRIENLVAPLRNTPGRFDIRTPAAVTSVRGTDFRVATAGESMRAEVTSGGVNVSNDAAAIDVPEGYGTVARAGAALAAPVPLLPAPDIAGLPARFDRLPVSFAMPAGSAAGKLRFQVAGAAGFDSPVFDAQAVDGILRVGGLGNGAYRLRVRGIDGNGLEGLDAEHEFKVVTEPAPPLVLGYDSKSAIVAARPVLAWAERSDLDRYHLQLARAPDFAQLLLDDRDLRGGSLLLPPELGPGDYYWRIAAISPDGERGPFSDTQSFRHVSADPLRIGDVSGELPRTLRWREGRSGDRYLLQIAADASFRTLLREERVSRATASLESLAPGTCYLRLAIIDGSGHKPAFGTVQRLQLSAGPPEPRVLFFLPRIVPAV